jgi:hypothetical protein
MARLKVHPTTSSGPGARATHAPEGVEARTGRVGVRMKPPARATASRGPLHPRRRGETPHRDAAACRYPIPGSAARRADREAAARRWTLPQRWGRIGRDQGPSRRVGSRWPDGQPEPRPARAHCPATWPPSAGTGRAHGSGMKIPCRTWNRPGTFRRRSAHQRPVRHHRSPLADPEGSHPVDPDRVRPRWTALPDLCREGPVNRGTRRPGRPAPGRIPRATVVRPHRTSVLHPMRVDRPLPSRAVSARVRRRRARDRR